MNPEDLHPQFAEAFNARDLERLLALYESGATLLPTPGPARSGASEIREALKGFLVTPGRMTIKTTYAIQMGDIALLRASWSIETTQADGTKSVLQSHSAEVARRQRDGRWLYIIDYPFGSEPRP